MKRILGLDLGTNSIGWALIDDNKIVDKKVCAFPHSQRNEKREIRINPQNKSILKTKIFVKNNSRILFLSVIILSMFIFSIIFAEFWQLFLNLGIGGLISILTFDNKKNK